MDLKSTIESLLFVAGRPVKKSELIKVLKATGGDVQTALDEIKAAHTNSGIVLLEQNGSYLLSTNPENSAQVKNFLNAELREHLTDAALETLSIIAYKQPVSRAEIESIRGVNSQYTIRLLMMRGLIEKGQSTKDSRVTLYRTTHEFLQHMGLTSHSDLPDFEELTKHVVAPQGFDQKPPPEPPVTNESL